jgi:hypothetical protein
VVAGAATLWVVEVEEDAPQALTISVSTTAATGSRRCLMVFSRPGWVGIGYGLSFKDANGRELLPATGLADLNNR